MSVPRTKVTEGTTVSLPEMRRYIREWIKSLRESYAEHYGVVREPSILREIAHLEVALRLLTKKHLKPPLPNFLEEATHG